MGIKQLRDQGDKEDSEMEIQREKAAVDSLISAVTSDSVSVVTTHHTTTIHKTHH